MTHFGLQNKSVSYICIAENFLLTWLQMARSMGLRLTNRLRILWLRTCEFLKCIAWMCLLVKRHRVLYSTILTLLWTLFVYLSVSNVSANLHSISYHISIFITFKRNSTLQDMLILLLSVNLYV